MSIIKDFSFGGVAASTYGVQVADCSEWWSIPQRDIEYVSVPGRNGDLILDNGRWNNLEITFDVNRISDGTGIINLLRYLGSQTGYNRLTVSEDATHYRLAAFSSMVSPTFTQLKKASRASLPFNCKPQRFLTTDESGITAGTSYSTGAAVENPTLMTAKPLLYLYPGNEVYISSPAGQTGATFSFEVADWTADQPYVGHIEMDCDTLEITNGGSVDMSAYVTFYSYGYGNQKFPFLIGGYEGKFYHTDSGTAPVIYPRWWEL